jgi:Flp pilus assembly protein TadG
MSALALRRGAWPRTQRGVMSVLFTIGTLAVIGTAGMALDLGLAYRTKTALQNALDAAALDGAKTLNQTFDTALATTAAQTTFANNMGALAGGLTPLVQTSVTLNPFNPGSGSATNPPKFLRVSLAALPVTIRLARVLPGVGNSLNVGGTAVAGPIVLSQYCGAFPVMLCGTNNGDTDCSDYSCYGITGGPTTETAMTYGGSAIGPGNYGFVQYGGCTGGSCLRDELAGGNGNFCFTVGGTVTTQPGVNTGPAEQGYNTRFGIYNGPVNSSTYPPDVITTNNDTGTPSFFYGNYQTRLENPSSWNFPNGVPERRVVAVPVANCSTPINGRSSVTVVGAACFFLTRTLSGGVNKDTIYGQLMSTCPATGSVSPVPSGVGPYKIVLYQDPLNPRGT